MIKINKIKGLMRENGETQADIACLLDKSLRAVQYNFKKQIFTVVDLAKIAKHYDVNLSDLVE